MGAVLTDEIPSKLLTMVDGGNSIAWLGSGLSIPAGYPDWAKTVTALCGAPRVKFSPSSDPEVLMMLAEACKAKDKTAYEKTLADLFGNVVVRERRAYRLLAKMRFKAYITTNYDPLLYEAVRDENHDCYQYPVLDVLRIGASPSAAFYVHGLARSGGQPCGKNLVLAKSEFTEAYDDGGVVANFTQSVLTSCDVIFFGCSLDEAAVQQSLTRVQRVHDHMRRARPDAPLPQRAIMLPRQYTIKSRAGSSLRVPDRVREHNEQERFSSMNIEILRYETSGEDDHAEIEQILERVLLLSGAYRPPEEDLGIG